MLGCLPGTSPISPDPAVLEGSLEGDTSPLIVLTVQWAGSYLPGSALHSRK